jgi:hypothetical protein
MGLRAELQLKYEWISIFGIRIVPVDAGPKGGAPSLC